MAPSSLQQPAGGAKSAKFVSANPLDPMIKPFEDSGNEEDRSLQQALAENVDRRLKATIQDLQEKHRTGQNEVDHPDRAPTGPAYQAIRAQQQQLAAAQQQQQLQNQQQQQPPVPTQQLEHLQLKDDDDDDDDDEFDNLLDDPALDELRDRRLAELKQQHEQKQKHVARGHGQYRTIAQDDFLTECNPKPAEPDGPVPHVVVHFCHAPFERCQIMDQALQQLATQYVECKFVKVMAEKAPFFVQKFGVRTLPTLLVFHDGHVVTRLLGFEGLLLSTTTDHNDKKNVDKWPTWRLAQWLSQQAPGSLKYRGPLGAEKEALLEQQAAAKRGVVYRGLQHSLYAEDD